MERRDRCQNLRLSPPNPEEISIRGRSLLFSSVLFPRRKWSSRVLDRAASTPEQIPNGSSAPGAIRPLIERIPRGLVSQPETGGRIGDVLRQFQFRARIERRNQRYRGRDRWQANEQRLSTDNNLLIVSGNRLYLVNHGLCGVAGRCRPTVLMATFAGQLRGVL